MVDNGVAFRPNILNNEEECLVYGADNMSQFTWPVGNISSKCDRALACAKDDDVVVLKYDYRSCPPRT